MKGYFQFALLPDFFPNSQTESENIRKKRYYEPLFTSIKQVVNGECCPVSFQSGNYFQKWMRQGIFDEILENVCNLVRKSI